MFWYENFTVLQWIVLFIIIIYCWIWISRNEKFIDPEERFFRIEGLDYLYSHGLGEIVLGVRNFIFLMLLVGLLKLVS